ncbi:hypothetical protein ACHAXR_013154 [Thalassiosira sp. AJA248-18]
MDPSNGSAKDDSNINVMNEAENGMQNGEGLPNDQDMDFMGDTQLLGAAAPDGNDRDDAESSGSSAAEMSGGTNRSSGGYSGDYSSISDESSDRAAKKKNKNGHRKGHTERTIEGDDVDDDDDGGGSAMMGGDEASASKQVDISGVHPSAIDARLRPRESANLNGHVTPRRHSTRHQDAPGEHIHSYHRHSHNHHHLPREAKGKTEAVIVNQKIDEIMNLYNVSLQAVATQAVAAQTAAAATRDDNGKCANDPNGLGSCGQAASLQVEADGGISSVAHPQGLKAPQLGGLRICDPSDPRVNIQQLYQASTSLPNTTSIPAKRSSELLDAPENGEQQPQGSECYANLMEACRPFFHDSNAPLAPEPPPMLPTNTAHQNVGSEQSSSGFTSFFNSSESNQTNGSRSGGFSSEPSQHKKSVEQPQTFNQDDAVDQGNTVDQASCPPGEAEESNQAYSSDNNSAYHSDASSMVVLARVKRKHTRQTTSSSNSDNINASRERSSGDNTEGASKRVRIDAMALDGARHRSQTEASKSQGSQPPTKQGDGGQQQRTESSSHTSSLTQSLDSSGSDSGGQLKKKEEDSNVEGSSNTDSTTHNQPTEANQTDKPRVVTDTSGTTTANGSSGSGTGSSNENNTTSKSESGSGDGNSDEQKVSGERDSTGGSDGCGGGSSAAPNEDTKPENSQPAAHGMTDKPLIHHHHHGGHHEKAENGKAPPEGSNVDPELAANVHQDGVEAMVSKEKIIEKKRKRMNMRREYEEEVQRQMRDSSESISIDNETALEPGKPVTLEDVLVFTKTARLLVQALPPFLAVHVNAAFTSLCGIQSSVAIGTPVASMISLPDATANKESDSSGSDITNNKDGMSSLSGSGDGNGQNNSNMATANAASIQRGDAGAPRAENDRIIAGLRIDRLIVARGYGHIHDVEVVSVPHHSHSHAIEGSEVKFIEGNGPAKRKKKEYSKILCRMSVSPVISTAPADPWHHGTDANSSYQPTSNAKRRKTRPGSNESNSVKHYLIQLEAVDGPRLLISRSSSASTDTTMEAQLLGITKTEVQARRCRMERLHAQNQGNDQANRPGTEDSQEENTSSGMEPVVTCG